ncbi:MAG: pyridoxal-phosphate dependent enzyme, partial [Actinobacteria bacterium]|nr:pyridoxal-phosphate dependent enzyme [Actinomycetota bacterium]
MIDPVTIDEAANRIEPHVLRTPLLTSDPLSERHGADIAIKCEHLQRTGSFKVRGSANVVHSLSADLAAEGVITASSGNHGIGVATAAASRGFACTIYLPEAAAPSKIAQIRRLGAEIVLVEGTDTSRAEMAARRAAEERGITYVSPYNDPRIIAGQGTIGKEILEDGVAPDAVVVSVGGGGLISGIATWIKASSPSTLVIGASAANDRAMAASIDAGEIITPHFEPTFSDGTAGGLEDDTITFDICRALVDRWVDISELEIARAVASMIDDHHHLVEGAAGV